jgi:hypothetical protein
MTASGRRSPFLAAEMASARVIGVVGDIVGVVGLGLLISSGAAAV